jgi:pimeloyl-ACP methyl ester carboxylesterase
MYVERGIVAAARAQHPPDHTAHHLPFWQEALFGIEILLLHASPVYYGLGVPRGDGSAVIIVPGFLGSDLYLVEMYAWLRRLGYHPYFSGIGLNADCPNLLIRTRLNQTLEKARRETRRKVHLLGHSLGGLLARSVAGERPDQVASVLTLGSPFRGTVLHPRVKQAVESVRQHILLTHGNSVLPDCYTGRCTCAFLSSLRRELPGHVMETAVYTRTDGFVDWNYCVTGDPQSDFEVTGTHVGLAFNPAVFSIIANRLAARSGRRSPKAESSA